MLILWISFPIEKINIIAQFSLDLLLIQYWELLVACRTKPNHSYMNGLNYIDTLMND